MKIQKIVLAILVVVALMAGSYVKTFAAGAPYTCTVGSAGVTTSVYKVVIVLNYVSGAPTPVTLSKAFYAPVGYEKEFLAIALSAIDNGKKVRAFVDFDTPTSTTILNLYQLSL